MSEPVDLRTHRQAGGNTQKVPRPAVLGLLACLIEADKEVARLLGGGVRKRQPHIHTPRAHLHTENARVQLPLNHKQIRWPC